MSSVLSIKRRGDSPDGGLDRGGDAPGSPAFEPIHIAAAPAYTAGSVREESRLPVGLA
jgi:hypothetical protein